MEKFDYIVAGGGVAGLSLCYFITQQPNLSSKKILVIDSSNSSPKETIYYSLWADKDFPFWNISSQSWNKFAVYFKSGQFRLFNLNEYKFGLLTNKELSKYLKKNLKNNKKIRFYKANVDQISVEKSGTLKVPTNKEEFLADFIFDSTYKKVDSELLMYGQGVLVELDKNHFNSNAITFYDARLIDSENLMFFYVIPLSETKAIIECTIIQDNSAKKISQSNITELISSYIKLVLKSELKSLVELPSKDIYLNTKITNRYPHKNHLLIGSQGGLVKSTSGFGFVRIVKDCELITKSLAKSGTPPKFQKSLSLISTHLLDRLLSRVIKNSPHSVNKIFTDLFLSADNGDKILGFLAEENKFQENISLLRKVSPLPFIINIKSK